MFHVAVAIIINPQQQILVAKRASHKHQGGLWEFPGGKVEPQESIYDALVREIKEEVNLEIISAKPLLTTEYCYDDKKIVLNTWLVREFSGMAQGMEKQEIRWVTLQELERLEIPAANRVIINHLLKDPSLCSG